MKKVLTFVTLALAASSLVFGSVTAPPAAPEIDANTAASALALLSGALMMLRRKR